MTDIYIENDNYIQLDALQDSGTNEYVNDATVSITTILDALGVEVTGTTYPITMSYVSASSGRYIALLPSTLDLSNGGRYRAIIDVSGGGLVGQFVKNITARTRGL